MSLTVETKNTIGLSNNLCYSLAKFELSVQA